MCPHNCCIFNNAKIFYPFQSAEPVKGDTIVLGQSEDKPVDGNASPESFITTYESYAPYLRELESTVRSCCCAECGSDGTRVETPDETNEGSDTSENSTTFIHFAKLPQPRKAVKEKAENPPPASDCDDSTDVDSDVLSSTYTMHAM